MNMAGYFTGYVGKFHIGDLNFDHPGSNPEIPVFEPGLDPDSPETQEKLKKHQYIVKERVRELTEADFAASVQWENPETLPIPETRHHNLEWFTQGVYEFIQEVPQNESWFLHLNTTAYHGPNHHTSLLADPVYTPGGKLDDPYRFHPPRSSIFDRLIEMGIDTGNVVPDHIRHYNTGILYLDDQVGAVMKILRESDQLENTLVILTADHAIEPGKSTCYERGVRVPFIAFWANNIPEKSYSDELIQFTDFLPTFASLGGVQPDPDLKLDGTDISPVFNGQSLEREYLYFEEGYTRAVRNKKFKYIAMRFPEFVLDSIRKGKSEVITHFGPRIQAHGLIASKNHEGYFAADQLYDLENDPWEQNNLAALPEYKTILKQMKNALSEYLAGLDPDFPLADTSFVSDLAYLEKVRNTMNTDLSAIPW
jgi:arylsulfatase A-like enzyme